MAELKNTINQKMEKKTVIARIQVAKDKINDYLALTEPLIKATKAEPGNLVYTLYQSTEDPTEFIVYEEYVDDKAFEYHSNSDAFKAFARQVQPLLAKELDVQVF